MGNYTKNNQNNQNNQDSSKIIIERIVEKEQKSIDMSELATAVANAIMDKLPTQRHIQVNGVSMDENDTDSERELTQKTLEKLAKNMILNNKNDSNFKELGRTSETQRDINEINKSIDLLSNLDN